MNAHLGSFTIAKNGRTDPIHLQSSQEIKETPQLQKQPLQSHTMVRKKQQRQARPPAADQTRRPQQGRQGPAGPQLVGGCRHPSWGCVLATSWWSKGSKACESSVPGVHWQKSIICFATQFVILDFFLYSWQERGHQYDQISTNCSFFFWARKEKVYIVPLLYSKRSSFVPVNNIRWLNRQIFEKIA